MTRTLAARSLTVFLALLLGVGSLLSPAPTVAAPAAQPAAPDTATTTYSIAGRVTDTNGSPVSGVTVTATFSPKKIVFLPGIMGTELGNTPRSGCTGRPSGKLWLDITSLGNLAPLYLNNDGTGPRNACDAISPLGRLVWPVSPYENFINEAQDRGFTVLPYPGYDWRLSIDDSVAKLDAFIDQHAAGSQVYLVAHSMGGLVARAYVADATRAAKIAGVATVGTPYLGAPLMAQKLATGSIMWLLDRLVDANQVREIIRYSPGSQTLLPSAAYMDGLHGPYYLPKTDARLDTYRKTADYFVQQGYVSGSTLANAEAYHAAHDGFNANFHAANRYTVFLGLDHPTPSTVREKPCRFSATGTCTDVQYWRMGDDTVPLGSSDLRWLSAAYRAGVQFCAYSALYQNFPPHQNLFTDDRIVDDILSVLNGGEPSHCDEELARQAEAAAPPFRVVTIWGQGQVTVTNDAGVFTGPGANGAFVNGLPDVTYIPTEGGVILTLPQDAPYRIVVEPTGDQSMQITAANLVQPTAEDDFSAQAQALFDTVAAPAGSRVTLPAAGSNLPDLRVNIDTNRDGAADQTLPPASVVADPAAVQDSVMPTTTITLSGPQDAQGRFTGPLVATLDAVDNQAGVLATYYSLDSGITWQPYTSALTIEPAAATALHAYSTDKVGNQEYPARVASFTFANVQRLYLPTLQRAAASQAVPAAALPPAPVAAIAPDSPGAHPSGVDAAAPTYTAITGADGRYTINGLPAGAYIVTVNRSGATPAQRAITLPPAATDRDFTVPAPPNRPPTTPHSPSPADGATATGLAPTLTWQGGDPDGDVVTYTVRLGTVNPPPVAADQTQTTYSPTTLLPATTYYWQIVAQDTHGAASDGPVWHFTTEAAAPELPVAITAGKDHTCALTTAGGVKCWGGNTYGQLGNGTTENNATPHSVTGLSSGVSAIEAGYTHTCALTEEGSVYCWGYTPSEPQQLVPTLVTGLPGPVQSLALGNGHTCALTEAGSVYCWGSNSYGQLGNNSTSDSRFPVPVTGLSNGVSALGAGRAHTCAVLAVGTVWCWGRNDYGQLGAVTNTSNQTTPVAVAELGSDIRAIAAGIAHTCALDQAGSIKCWGNNSQGQLGDGTTRRSTLPVPVSGISERVVAIAAGGSEDYAYSPPMRGHTCALTESGGVKCWGDNRNSQLGDGSDIRATSPSTVRELNAVVVSLAAGGEHTCGLTSENRIKCWGASGRGQLGIGSSSVHFAPVQVTNLAGNASAIASGRWHSCAISRTGGVQCWGENGWGMLGDGTRTRSFVPVNASGLSSDMVEVAVGGHFFNTYVTTPYGHSCALGGDGGVWCWGINGGRLGDGTSTDRDRPVSVIALDGRVNAISVGIDHSCALMQSGGVKCWGLNTYGQLGDGTTTNRSAPVAVTGLDAPIVQLAAGSYHTCGVTNSGSVQCWGRNDVGQLGDGTSTHRSYPVLVAGLSGKVVAFATGRFSQSSIVNHACAVLDTGSVMCWGNNDYGQLGNGTEGGRTTTPVTVLALNNAVNVTVGLFHSCAVTSLGEVKCWGGAGQLGDGTNSSRSAPVPVLNLEGVVAIDAGAAHTCAVTSAGDAKCWGSNGSGQLGVNPGWFPADVLWP